MWKSCLDPDFNKPTIKGHFETQKCEYGLGERYY